MYLTSLIVQHEAMMGTKLKKKQPSNYSGTFKIHAAVNNILGTVE